MLFTIYHSFFLPQKRQRSHKIECLPFRKILNRPLRISKKNFSPLIIIIIYFDPAHRSTNLQQTVSTVYEFTKRIRKVLTYNNNNNNHHGHNLQLQIYVYKMTSDCHCSDCRSCLFTNRKRVSERRVL